MTTGGAHALADESRFQRGRDTFLTVQLEKVNLPDGTILGVSFDFKPLGSITLAQGAGTLTVSLGHFAESCDQVTVKNGGATILTGGSSGRRTGRSLLSGSRASNWPTPISGAVC